MNEQEKYPIGKFSGRPVWDAAAIAQDIDRVAQLPYKLEAAIAGLTWQQLDTPYREGGWTVRQVVHHVADSHMNSFIRFKWTLTESSPLIKAYDEKEWAKTPEITADPTLSVALLKALHAKWVLLMKGLTEQDWNKHFVHPDGRNLKLNHTLGLYAWHGDHHLAHITRLRERNGW